MHPLRAQRTYVALGLAVALAAACGFFLASVDSDGSWYYVVAIVLTSLATVQALRAGVGISLRARQPAPVEHGQSAEQGSRSVDDNPDAGQERPAAIAAPPTGARSPAVSAKTIHVLVVAENPTVRRGLVSMLERADLDAVVVGQGAGHPDAAITAHALQADVVVLDLYMSSPVDDVGAIAALSPDFTVLAISRSHDEQHVMDLLAAGAGGCLFHGQFGAEELVTSVRQLAQSETIRGRVIPDAERFAPPHQLPAVLPELTAREREVLALVAAGLSDRDIASRLILTERMVAVHVDHSVRKLGVNHRAQAAARWLAETKAHQP